MAAKSPNRMRMIRNTKRSPPHMVKSYCKTVTECEREHTMYRHRSIIFTDKGQLHSYGLQKYTGIFFFYRYMYFYFYSAKVTTHKKPCNKLTFVWKAKTVSPKHTPY